MTKDDLYRKTDGDSSKLLIIMDNVVNEIVKYLENIDFTELTKQEYSNISKKNWENKCNIYSNNFKKTEGNIYFLYNNKKALLYIGTSSSKKINSRLKQHLFKKSKKTRSKLENVKNYILDKNGTCIYYNAIKVPDEIRTSIEDALIKRLTPEWNERNNNK